MTVVLPKGMELYDPWIFLVHCSLLEYLELCEGALRGLYEMEEVDEIIVDEPQVAVVVSVTKPGLDDAFQRLVFPIVGGLSHAN